MNDVIVSTWKTDCGIAEHTALLKAYMPGGEHVGVFPELLDPHAVHVISGRQFDVLHLNYHAALHSRWTPDVIRQWRQNLGIKVLVTYHDSGVPNADQCRAVCAAADYFVLHEPYDDLPAHGEYLRMGVPALDHKEVSLGRDRWKKAYPDQPFLGSIGFPFPWKNYDELARVTATNGWGLFLIAPRATAEQIDHWRSLNPYTVVRNDFLCRKEAVRLLHDCDATAFCYTCANTGQSGAILQGIAARKPVLAFSDCRQFRALYADPLAQETIRWAHDFTEVGWHLRHTPIGRVCTETLALAEQESWTRVGQRYAAIYRVLEAR